MGDIGYPQSPYEVLFGTGKNDMGGDYYGSGVNRKEYRNVNLVRHQLTDRELQFATCEVANCLKRENSTQQVENLKFVTRQVTFLTI